MTKEDTGKKIGSEATISRDAFIRAWSYGTLAEQGEMLFDLIGESVIVRMRIQEEKLRQEAKRIDILEANSNQLKEYTDAMTLNVEKKFSHIEKKWAYIAGGVAVIATLVSPVAAVLTTLLIKY